MSDEKTKTSYQIDEITNRLSTVEQNIKDLYVLKDDVAFIKARILDREVQISTLHSDMGNMHSKMSILQDSSNRVEKALTGDFGSAGFVKRLVELEKNQTFSRRTLVLLSTGVGAGWAALSAILSFIFGSQH